MILLASACHDYQHAQERFALSCEAAKMKVSSSKAEAMVHLQKRVDCYLQVEGQSFTQVEKCKYLRVLF